MKTFGASAPLKQLQQKFGFTAEHVAAAARQAIASDRGVIVPPTEALPVGE
jgi:transketolase